MTEQEAYDSDGDSSNDGEGWDVYFCGEDGKPLYSLSSFCDDEDEAKCNCIICRNLREHLKRVPFDQGNDEDNEDHPSDEGTDEDRYDEDPMKVEKHLYGYKRRYQRALLDFNRNQVNQNQNSEYTLDDVKLLKKMYEEELARVMSNNNAESTSNAQEWATNPLYGGLDPLL